MTADVRAAHATTESGVEWLGKVPNDWDIRPGRACFRQKKQPNLGLRETTVLSLSFGSIVVKPREKLHGLVPASFETYQIVDPLDIVVRPTDLQNDQNSPRFGFSKHRGTITSAYLCLRTEDGMVPEYGHLLLHSYDLMKVFYGLGSGLRQNLDWTDFKLLPCTVPPVPEQGMIVRFLAQMETQIERYKRSKQQLITLLEEQKQTLVHHAVTGQIDVRTGEPYRAYKDSQVDWLKKVPAHWSVERLKCRMANITEQTNVRNDDDLYVSLEHVESWTGRLTEIDEGIEFDSQVKSFQAGDILFGKLRPYLAKVTRPNRNGVCVGEFLVLRPRDKKMVGTYVERSLRAKPLIDAVDSSTFGAKMPRADWHIVGTMPITVPPVTEQAEIARFLNDALAQIDAGMAAAKQQIKLVEELCERLTADVVTGKLEVREAASTPRKRQTT